MVNITAFDQDFGIGQTILYEIVDPLNSGNYICLRENQNVCSNMWCSTINMTLTHSKKHYHHIKLWIININNYISKQAQVNVLFFNVKIKEVNQFWLKRRIAFIFNERRYVSIERHFFLWNLLFQLFFNLAIKEHKV